MSINVECLPNGGTLKLAQRSAASEISIENTHMTSMKHVRVCAGVGVAVCVSVSVCTPAHFTVTC